MAGYPSGLLTLLPVRVLLVNTYELGRQPIHLASPAAALAAAGVGVDLLDLAVDELDWDAVEGADAAAFSVPMHTAMRLAVSVAERIRVHRPELPIAFYGLYAGVSADQTLGSVADALFAGEYQSDLVGWVLGLDQGARPRPALRRHVGGTRFHTPDRSRLPDHARYSRLEWEGEARLAAAVEASHGCRHRCLHCPIPALYDGRIRLVGAGPVLADVDRLAGAGVRHVTFADPDFLNAPRYSIDLLREAHAAHPDLTFDVTAKVEHILGHPAVWEDMARLGVLFVVSAFESVDDPTLGILEKGHTVADMSRAVDLLRRAGVHLRPTWLPFFPWTRPEHLGDLVAFLDHHRLWSATDPVQLAIKLLIPEGSLLESHPEVTPHLVAYRPERLTWEWRFTHPESERLHSRLDAIAAAGSDCGQEAQVTLEEMRAEVAATLGEQPGPMPSSPPAPRLSESWFCCAEPTEGQATAIGLTIGRAASSSI